MTLLPSESWNVRRTDGPKPQFTTDMCMIPGCPRLAQSRHHIWRRSATAGPADWVTIDNQWVSCNVIPVCNYHHDMLTGMVGGHRGWIKWDPVHELTWWELRDGDHEEVHWEHVSDISLTVHTHSDDAEVCKTCGHRKKRVKKEPLPPLEKRPQSKVVITVPADLREDGAALYREAMDWWKEILGRGDEKGDYVPLMLLFHLVRQHQHLLKLEEA